MAKTILVVDDKREIRIMLDQYLSQEGFDVVEAADGQEALFVSRQTRPDLIILDLMMPNMGGYDFMRAYAKEADTPIILLTAKLEESDKVLGLELGADDYVTKPFSLRELTARVRAVLRRLEKQPADGQRLLRVADITLDESRRQVTVNDAVVALTPSEFDLLALFLRHPGRVFTRTELLDRLQGDAYEGYERTIDVHIRNLRSKIEPDSRNPRYIETVYGIGYRFDGVVRPTLLPMRSLTLKLTLAFLIVGLIGALLVAFFVGQRTGREFDQFLALQERARLISELQDVYTATGDWTGLEERLGGQLSRDAARMMIMGTLLDSEGRYLAGRPPRADNGRSPRPDLAEPIVVNGEIVGYLLIDAPDFRRTNQAAEEAFRDNVRRAVVLSALFATLVALVVGIGLARTITGPLRELTAATRDLAAGELGLPGARARARRVECAGRLLQQYEQRPWPRRLDSAAR